MNKHTKQEAISILREVAYKSDIYNQRKLWYVIKLVNDKPKHSGIKSSDLALPAFLIIGFLCAWFMNNHLN